MQSEIVYLMYHELEVPGRQVCNSDPGYVRYVLPISDFTQQMHALKDGGWTGICVSEALAAPREKAVAITFDDGCETDLVAAAPVLQTLGFHATFYVSYAFLGTPGYLSQKQVQELQARGFEIGSHSMTHAYLPDLDEAALHYEIADSKVYLEHLLGGSVAHFSCPGGRCNRRVKELVQSAGYRSLATSRPHANSRFTDPYALGRAPVLRGTTLQQFQAMCRGFGLWRMNLGVGMRQSAMRILGNAFYDRLRGAVLSKSN